LLGDEIAGDVANVLTEAFVLGLALALEAEPECAAEAVASATRSCEGVVICRP
jgi:hypothetical protein